MCLSVSSLEPAAFFVVAIRTFKLFHQRNRLSLAYDEHLAAKHTQITLDTYENMFWVKLSNPELQVSVEFEREFKTKVSFKAFLIIIIIITVESRFNDTPREKL